MTLALTLELVGAFLVGATPWLEAIVVVPVDIAAGLPFAAVVVAAVSGNVLTIALAIRSGATVRGRWERRRARWDQVPDAAATRTATASDPSSSPVADPMADPTPQPSAPPSTRARRVFDRWGLPGLSILGPIGLGTQVSAALAVTLGVDARRTLVWMSAATLGWALAAGALALGGLRLVGIGS